MVLLEMLDGEDNEISEPLSYRKICFNMSVLKSGP